MKHVIIAGTARAGKTSLCYELHKKGYVHIKVDSIKRGICEVYGDKNNWKNFSPKLVKIATRLLNEIDTDTIAGKEYYVIDTCHLLPGDAVALKDKALIIFMGYSKLTKEEVVENIRKYDKPNYWTYKLTDDELLKIAQDGIIFSKQIEAECEKMGIKYVDTSYNRNKVINETIEYIESTNR